MTRHSPLTAMNEQHINALTCTATSYGIPLCIPIDERVEKVNITKISAPACSLERHILNYLRGVQIVIPSCPSFK